MKSIKENLETIHQHIEDSCSRVGRNPDEVRLMAVTKTRSIDEIEAAYQVGHRLFGENRVQEAVSKYEGFHRDAELHLIGHLQSNKAKQTCGLFSCVQSIDKLKTAVELDKRCGNAGVSMDILLEYNTSGENSKSGFRSEDELYRDLEGIMDLEHLRIRGLMTIGPFTAEEKPIRRSFSFLRDLYHRIQENYDELDMDTLSMGMSGDYDYAVEEGSNLVRIGTAIFGPRDYR